MPNVGGCMSKVSKPESRTVSLEALLNWVGIWLPGFVRPSRSAFRDVLSAPWANSKAALSIAGLAGLLTTSTWEVWNASHPGSTEAGFVLSNSPIVRTGILAFAYLVSFVIEIAVMQVIAYLLGGRGSFTQLSFLVAVYGTPLDVLASLTSTSLGRAFYALPALCLLPLYSFLLRYVAVRSVHNLAKWPTLAVMIPGMLVSTCATLTFYLAIYPWPHNLVRPPL